MEHGDHVKQIEELEQNIEQYTVRVVILMKFAHKLQEEIVQVVIQELHVV